MKWQQKLRLIFGVSSPWPIQWKEQYSEIFGIHYYKNLTKTISEYQKRSNTEILVHITYTEKRNLWSNNIFRKINKNLHLEATLEWLTETTEVHLEQIQGNLLKGIDNKTFENIVFHFCNMGNFFCNIFYAFELK